MDPFEQGKPAGGHSQIRLSGCDYREQAILCDLFGMVKWAFQKLSNLQLGDKRVILNPLVESTRMSHEAFADGFITNGYNPRSKRGSLGHALFTITIS